MALGFILIGIVLIIVAIRNTYKQLGQQLVRDFSGPGNFWYWIAALAIIGAIGYVPYLRTPSRMLLALIIVVFLLTNGSGFFSQLNSALSATPTPSQAPPEPVPTGPIPVQLNIQGGGASGAVGAIGSVAKAIPFIGGLFG